MDQLNLREPLLEPESYQINSIPWYKKSFTRFNFISFLLAASLLSIVITLPIGFSKNCDPNDDKCKQDRINILTIPLLVFVGISFVAFFVVK
jgi:hypothetical protein